MRDDGDARGVAVRPREAEGRRERLAEHDLALARGELADAGVDGGAAGGVRQPKGQRVGELRLGVGETLARAALGVVGVGVEGVKVRGEGAVVARVGWQLDEGGRRRGAARGPRGGRRILSPGSVVRVLLRRDADHLSGCGCAESML